MESWPFITAAGTDMCQLPHRGVRMPGSFVMGTPVSHKGNLVTVLPAPLPSEVAVMR